MPFFSRSLNFMPNKFRITEPLKMTIKGEFGANFH